MLDVCSLQCRGHNGIVPRPVEWTTARIDSLFRVPRVAESSLALGQSVLQTSEKNPVTLIAWQAEQSLRPESVSLDPSLETGHARLLSDWPPAR